MKLTLGDFHVYRHPGNELTLSDSKYCPVSSSPLSPLSEMTMLTTLIYKSKPLGLENTFSLRLRRGKQCKRGKTLKINAVRLLSPSALERLNQQLLANLHFLKLNQQCTWVFLHFKLNQCCVFLPQKNEMLPQTARGLVG